MKMRLNLSLIAIGFTTICSAQDLVKDINAIPGTQVRAFNAYGEKCVPCGNYIFFPGTDAEHGTELWRSDGTAEGTIMLKDIYAGTSDGVVRGSDMICMNNIVYFPSFGLWRSDGTEEGTIQVNPTNTNGLVRFQDKIAYRADGTVYVTTGEPNNETVFQFPVHANEYSVADLVPAEDLVFIMLNRVSTLTGNIVTYELWIYDGTDVTMLKSFSNSVGFASSVTVGNKVIFRANDGTSGTEHWVSDGTLAGTQLLLDINPGTGGIQALDPVKANGKAFLNVQTVDYGVWVTDGTPGGTTKIVPGFTAREIRMFNGRLYMNGANSNGSFIKRMDVDYNNQVDVSPPADWPVIMLDEVAGKLFYALQDDDVGNEVYYLDGNADPLSMLKDINPGDAGSYSRSAGVVNNTMIFLADDGVHGFEFWKTDGTPENTMLMKDIATNTANPKIGDIYVHDDKMYFLANDISTAFSPSRLWVSDGTEDGTHIVNDTEYNETVFAPVGNRVIGLANFPQSIIKTDLTTGVTSQLADPTEYSGYGGGSPNHSIIVGNDTYFYLSASPVVGVPTGNELWTANPETNEFHIVKNIGPGFQSSDVFDGVHGAGLNDKLIFSALSAEGIEPWVTDGTEDGTFLLKDIHPTGNSGPDYFINIGNYVLFFATSPETGYAVWSTDGTVEGTRMVKQVAGAAPQEMGRIGNKVIFAVTNSTQTLDVWTSDGTPEGTSLLAQVPGNSYLFNFMTVGNKVYFVENNQTLWVTDGTEAGTKKTGVEQDLLLSAAYTTQGDKLFFTSNGSIWMTMGTPETTRSIGPGTPVGGMYAIGDHLYFIKDDVQYGRELFKVAIPQLNDQQITVTGLDNVAYGKDYTVTATSSSALSVTLTSSDQTIAELDGNKLIIHKTGTVTFTAQQNGSEEFAPATKSIVVVVAKGSQQINFAAVAPRRFDDHVYPVEATATSNLTVTYSASTTTVGKITIAQNILTFVAPGKVAITASQAGNENYESAGSVTQTFCINPSRPTITQSTTGTEVTLTSSATTNVWTRNDTEIEFTGASFTPTENGIYKAAAVVDECKGEFSNPVNFSITGLDDKSSEIEFFPNPAEESITITCRTDSHIRILDVAGKEQINEIARGGESIIDVSSFAAGMYFIVIRNETQTYRSKFLKK